MPTPRSVRVSLGVGNLSRVEYALRVQQEERLAIFMDMYTLDNTEGAAKANAS